MTTVRFSFIPNDETVRQICTKRIKAYTATSVWVRESISNHRNIMESNKSKIYSSLSFICVKNSYSSFSMSLPFPFYLRLCYVRFICKYSFLFISIFLVKITIEYIQYYFFGSGRSGRMNCRIIFHHSQGYLLGTLNEKEADEMCV